MHLQAYLASLGNSSEEVANALRKQGVKGLARSSCHCPILNAIYKAIPNYWPGLRIIGGGESEYCATLQDSQIIDPTLPPPVLAFIRDFDDDKYPDLVASKMSVNTVRTWT